MPVCTVQLHYTRKYRVVETKMIHTTDRCRQPKDYMQKEYHEDEGDRHRAVWLFPPPRHTTIVCLMRKNLVIVYARETLVLISGCVFVTTVAIVIGELPNPNACRDYGGTLGTGSEGQGSAKC